MKVNKGYNMSLKNKVTGNGMMRHVTLQGSAMGLKGKHSCVVDAIVALIETTRL